jgi:membrane-associated phospholipid phosphatase
MRSPALAWLKLVAFLGAVVHAAPAAAADEDPKRLRWHDNWRRVGALEYATTLTFGVAGFVLRQLDRPDEARWSRPVLFDDWMRDQLRVSGQSGRNRASLWSDILIIVGTAPPVLIDPLFVAWIGDSNPDVAWQMTVLNAQSHAIANFVTNGTKRLADRARPYVQTCEGPERDESCGSDADYEAFFSGHASTAATSAGLYCAHHTNLPLYGGGFADTAACIGGIGIATTASALRIAADKHWATDVLVGNFVGYLAGYLLPTLGYYHDIRLSPANDATGARLGWTPMLSETGVGVAAFGWF